MDTHQAINAVYDYLTAKGVEFPEYYKRRDPKEPGRVEKEKAEDKLAKLVRRLFAAQKESVKAWLEEQYPGRKFAQTIPADILKNDDIEALIFKILFGLIEAGAALSLGTLPSIVDLDSVLAKTIEWVQSYGYDLVKGINDTTLQGIRNALDAFTSTPGMTIGDVIEMMPFGPVRAQMVAVTEITRAYAEGDARVAEQLMLDYPDLRVVKTWYTNNDDLARKCPVCWPAHEQTVLANRAFRNGFDSPPGHPNCRCWRATRVDILGSEIE